MQRREADELWGAKAIANCIGGVSVDTVYGLALDPDAPIYKPSGRYFARRSEIKLWLRTKPEKPRSCQI